MPVVYMFSRSIIDNSRSINDASRVIRMTVVSDAPSCGIILITLELSFTIVIYKPLMCLYLAVYA